MNKKNDYFNEFPLNESDISLFLKNEYPQLLNEWVLLSVSERNDVTQRIEKYHFNNLNQNLNDLEQIKNGTINEKVKVAVNSYLMKDFNESFTELYDTLKMYVELNLNGVVIDNVEFNNVFKEIKEPYRRLIYKEISKDIFKESIKHLKRMFKDYDNDSSYLDDLNTLINDVDNFFNNFSIFKKWNDEDGLSDLAHYGFAFINDINNKNNYLLTNYLNSLPKELRDSELSLMKDEMCKVIDFTKKTLGFTLFKKKKILMVILDNYCEVLDDGICDEYKKELENYFEKKYQELENIDINILKHKFNYLNLKSDESFLSPENIFESILLKKHYKKTGDYLVIENLIENLIENNEINILLNLLESVNNCLFYDKNDNFIENVLKNNNSVNSLMNFVEKDMDNFSLKINCLKLNIITDSLVYPDSKSNGYNENLNNYLESEDISIKTFYISQKKIVRWQNIFNKALEESKINAPIVLVLNDTRMNKVESKLELDVSINISDEYSEKLKKEIFNMLSKYITDTVGLIYGTGKLSYKKLTENLEPEMLSLLMKEDVTSIAKNKSKIIKY